MNLTKAIAPLLLFGPILLFSSQKAQAISYFDQAIEKNGGQIPYPFENLVGVFSKNVDVLLIPDGRSLQKNSADFKNPRMILAIRQEPSGFVFLGHAPNKDEVEVISWNPDLRKFEFRLVENYKKDATPHSKDPGGTCFACHQSGGPILSRAPWREIVSIDEGMHRGGHTLWEKVISEMKSEKYHGFDFGKNSRNVRRDVAGGTDDNVRTANNLLQAQNVCKSVCKGDDALKCRELLLQSALESIILEKYSYFEGSTGPATRDLAKKLESYSFPHSFGEFGSKIRESWPEDGHGFPSSTLPDRDPFTDPKISPGFNFLSSENGITRDLTLTDEKTAASSVTQNPLFSEHFKSGKYKEVPMKPEEWEKMDPTYPRPLTRKISREDAPYYVYGIGVHCIWPDLGQAIQDSSQFQGQLSSREKIEEVIRDPRVKKALQGPWPDVRADVMEAIHEALKNPHSGGICVHCEQKRVETKAEEAAKEVEAITEKINPVLSIPSHRNPIENLHHYCSDCHLPPGKNTPLPLDNLEALKNYKDKKGRPFVSRIGHDMPPAHRSADFLAKNPRWKQDMKEMKEALEVQQSK